MREAKQVREKIKVIESALLDIHNLVVEDGLFYEDFYKEVLQAKASEGKKGELTTIGTRVRSIGNSFSAEWNEKSFYTPAGGTKKKVSSKYIKKTSPEGYGAHIFNGQPDWVRDAGTIVEGRYKFLRKQSAILTQIRKRILFLEEVLSKCETESGI